MFCFLCVRKLFSDREVNRILETLENNPVLDKAWDVRVSHHLIIYDAYKIRNIIISDVLWIFIPFMVNSSLLSWLMVRVERQGCYYGINLAVTSRVWLPDVRKWSTPVKRFVYFVLKLKNSFLLSNVVCICFLEMHYKGP